MRIALALVVVLCTTAAASAATAPAAGIGLGILPAVQYELQIDEIPGESTARGFENQIDVLSFSWGETLTVARTTGAGGAAGKSSPHDLTVTKHIDKASPVLMKACASGRHLPKVILHAMRNGDGRRFEFLTLTLEDVFVSSYQVGGAGAGELPTETLSLNFTKISFAERSQMGDGSVTPPVIATFDFAQNRAE